jgi:hypothetical protein
MAKLDRQPSKTQTSSSIRRQSMRVEKTFVAVAAAGLTDGKREKRISGRTYSGLLEAAAERSGLTGTELIDYALAKVALEDDYAEKLLALEGSVRRDVDLEF